MGIVCGWQQGELARSRLDDALDRTSVGRSAVSVDVDIDILARLHVADSAFIDVGSNSQVVEIRDLDKRKALCYSLSLDCRDLDDGSYNGTGHISSLIDTSRHGSVSCAAWGGSAGCCSSIGRADGGDQS